MNVRAVLLVLLFSSLGWAEEPPVPAAPTEPGLWAFRSNPDARLWISADAGAIVTVGDGGGSGWSTGLRAAYTLAGRWDVSASWQTQSIEIYDPAHVRTQIYGLGAQYLLVKARNPRFFRGLHIKAFVLGQYGKSDYHVWTMNYYTYEKTDLAGGSTSGFGVSSGAQAMFPLFFGAWAHGRVGWEYMSFDYDEPNRLGGSRFYGIAKSNLFLQIGLDFAF